MPQQVRERLPEDVYSIPAPPPSPSLQEQARPPKDYASVPFRVLVVDDEPSLTEMIHAFLQQRHLNVDTASDGQSAQKMLEEQQYDLVLSDVCMPEVDGMALLQWIKKRYPKTDVIMMTGALPSEAVDEARRHGADDFLAKPFSAELMRAAVERCRQRHLSSHSREPSQTALLLKPLIHEMSAGLEHAATMLTMMQRSTQKSAGENSSPLLEATIINLFRLMGLTEEYCAIAFSLDDGEEVHADWFDLQIDVIEKILDDCSFEIKRKKIEVIQKRDRQAAFDPKMIKGNKVLLRSVFRTLFNTAVRYCNDSGRITYQCDKNLTHHEISIAHEGRPLPADVNLPTTQECNGAGYGNGNLEFGLSMVDSILRHYGGKLSCEPCPNGSCFLVSLPL